jgi:hypothetical protein
MAGAAAPAAASVIMLRQATEKNARLLLADR